MSQLELRHAHATVSFKSVDDDARVIEGIASTPSLDRGGDVMEPLGAQFKLPMPLLWQHKADMPIGRVTHATVTSAGIQIRAQIAKGVLPFIEDAWKLIKAGLVPGLSIGWQPLEGKPDAKGAFRYTKWGWHELSTVTIPMNADASITAIKSADAPYLAASGTDAQPHTPGASGTPVVKVSPSRPERQMKTIQDQILSYKSTRDQKFNEMQGLMTKAAEGGVTLDESEGQAYEGLEAEVKACDTHIRRLESMQEAQKGAAVPVAGNDPMAAHAARGGQATPIIRVQTNEEPGIGFAKAVLCKVASFLSQGAASPIEIAKARYPDNDRLQMHLKATIPAGTTTGVTWAAPFIDPTNLASEFIDFLRPMTILGKFGTNGIPSLRRVPFNVRILGQSSGGDAYWVGEGAPKPVTKFDFNAITMGFHKVATIAVITKELARFSTPSAERIVRDSLAKAVSARIDVDLIDPTQAAVTGVNPASLTNGLTPLVPSGTTADAARSDLARVVKTYLDNNNSVSDLVLIMPASLALSLSVMRNTLGSREFTDISLNGGTVEGIPVITSQYAANQSGAGNLVIAVNANDVLLADDGNVTVDVSNQASVQMLDNPTNSSATATATTLVSLWQTNSIGLLAEREITWAKARANAVVYMDDVNWGSIGSPA